MTTRKSGSRSRAVEWTVSASFLAVLASAGAPAPGSPQIARNQRRAIETLHKIAEAQARFRSLNAIDTDCDGRGEYGYFAELAGTRPMRVSNNCAPGAGTPADILSPPLLPRPFGSVGSRVVRHKGYYFQIWLPRSTVAGLVPAIPENTTGGCTTAPFPNPDNGESLWNCYAWPIDYGRTGNWAFFVNQQGIVFKCLNDSIVPYDGLAKWPSFFEAYVIPDDMSFPVRIGVPGGADNTIWTPVGP